VTTGKSVRFKVQKRKGRWALRHRPSLAAAGSRSPVPPQFQYR